MPTDPIGGGFRGIEDAVSSPPPQEILEAARSEAPRLRSRRREQTRRNLGIGAAVIATLVAGAFTAPGRAATDWVADLAGIGDPPTLDHPYDEPGAIVIETGELADGTPYEIVARVIDPAARFRSNDESEAAREPAALSLCFGIDLPTAQNPEQDSYCTRAQAGSELFSTAGAQLTDRGLGLVFGIVEDPSVVEVRVVDGRSEAPLTPTVLAPVPETLLNAVGRDDPVSFFLAPVDRALVDDAKEHGLCALGVDDTGTELGRTILIHGEVELRPKDLGPALFPGGPRPVKHDAARDAWGDAC